MWGKVGLRVRGRACFIEIRTFEACQADRFFGFVLGGFLRLILLINLVIYLFIREKE